MLFTLSQLMNSYKNKGFLSTSYTGSGLNSCKNCLHHVYHPVYCVDEYTVSEIQFRSAKCTAVGRTSKNFEELSIPIQAKQG